LGFSVTYLWVAIGGALGTIARFWFATTMTAITGPEFPWGTIIINIVGSFVIAFFGVLSAGGGRLSVPAEVRTFVMVGLCGGFTTFSSFSLQTLDLARAGLWAQAAGNVAISVVLCLTSVTLGFAAAAGINSVRST
jgi:CrcB protein